MLLYYSFPIYLEFDQTDVLCIAFVRTLKLQKLLVCFHSRRSLELFDVCLCVSACGDRTRLPFSMNEEECVKSCSAGWPAFRGNVLLRSHFPWMLMFLFKHDFT